MNSELPNIAVLTLNHDGNTGLCLYSDQDNNLTDDSAKDCHGAAVESQNDNEDKVNESFVTANDRLSDISSESKQNSRENGEAVDSVSLKQGDEVSKTSHQVEISTDRQLNNRSILPQKSNHDNITKISVVRDSNLIITTPKAKLTDARSTHERDLKSSKPRQVNINVPSGSSSRSSRHSSTADVQTIGKYRLLKTIGKGNFARVKLAIHIPTNRHVAIKMIDKTQLNASGLQKLFREVRIMKTLEHPNIVKLYEVIETERILYLVLEYASRGEIFDYLVTNGRMKEKDVRSKFRQILSAVQYCHKKRIVHRDLKAENLLLDSDLNIKLADFGFSNEYSPGNLLDTFCGSPPYAAPELFQGKKYEGPEVDVWSLGVILYTLVSGSLPFDGRNLRELREKIIKGKYRVPFYMTSDCEALLKRFLIINPKKRLTLENAMKDSWLNIGYETDRLEPYIEPSTSVDETRIDALIKMGYTESEILEAVAQKKYNDVGATYHLLGMKQSVLNDMKSLSSSSRFSSTPQKARPVVTPGKALSSTIRTDNARTSFSAGPSTKPRVSRNVSVNVTSTPTYTSRESSTSRGYPVRVMQSSSSAAAAAATSSTDDRRRSSAAGSGSNNGAISKNIVIQKLGPSRMSQREPSRSTYKDLRIKSTSTRMKSCTSMESTDMETNLLSCFPERHHRVQGSGLSQHQDSTSLYPCNMDVPYVIGTDKPRDVSVSANDSDLADGLLTVKAIQTRQKSPPGSPVEADLAEPTSPWSSAACSSPFYRRASDGRASVAGPSSSRPPSSQSPPSRPLSRHKIGRSTVHGSSASSSTSGSSTGAANNMVPHHQQQGGVGRGGRFSIDSQTPVGRGGLMGPLSPDPDQRRFSLFTRITARFNRK